MLKREDIRIRDPFIYTDVENNCYYNVMNPLVDFGAMNTLPGFAGDDYSDPASFMLSAGSPLIGAGVKIPGTDVDFYGNTIDSVNIGCYGGTGTENEYQPEGFFERIVRLIRNFFETIIHEIVVIFD